MAKRVRLNGGHTELNIEGMNYQGDETGAFTVPDEHAGELIRIHGGNFEPGIEQIEDNIAQLEAGLISAKNIVTQRAADLKAAQDALENFKKRQAEATKATTDAKGKGPVTGQPQQNQPQNNQRR